MSYVSSFFSEGSRYLVVGASKNPQKFGYKVLNWYIAHDLPVTPINPTSDSILGVDAEKSLVEAINKYLEDKSVKDFGVSFITAPPVTLLVINELIKGRYNDKNVIKSFWFQPGSFDEEIIQLSTDGLKVKTVIYDDCILVSGESALYQAKI